MLIFFYPNLLNTMLYNISLYCQKNTFYIIIIYGFIIRIWHYDTSVRIKQSECSFMFSEKATILSGFEIMTQIPDMSLKCQDIFIIIRHYNIKQIVIISTLLCI